MPNWIARRQRGVAMVEATIGTVLLLLAALGTIQLVLVFHGALAGHGAVMRAARTYAITRSAARANETFDLQMTTALGGIEWQNPSCQLVDYNQNGVSRAAQCQTQVIVPVVLPGAGLFTGNGITGPVTIEQTGLYPYGEQSGI